MRRATVCGVLLVIGCGAEPAGDPDAAPRPPRQLTATLTVDATGFSEELAFTIPETTRSLTVVVAGDPAALFALGSLRTPDGVERVGIDLGVPPGAAMREAYFDEQIGHMAGDLYQSIRLGTFTQVYPYAPGQPLPAGPASLRVASDAAGPVTVTVLLPEDDGAAVLHVNVFAVSDVFTFATPPSFLDEAQAIFAQAGITLVVDEVVALPGTAFERITDFNEPQEPPESQCAQLALLGPPAVQSDALNVFVVESLPFGVGGLSLGTPGPPLPTSYYYGTLLLYVDEDAVLGRIFAHEVAHFLALQHVENRGISGAVYPDPLEDTEPNQGNLMESGTTLTPDQAYALGRSALLRVD